MKVKDFKKFLEVLDDNDEVVIDDGEFEYEPAIMCIRHNRWIGNFLNISLDTVNKKEIIIIEE